MERRYDLDWLRIGAFGLLILYHVGMVFVPWDYHVKTPRPFEWATWPMLALNPWRLSLLFLISGVVSRLLFDKARGPASFAGQRSARLLIPLVAGLFIFVAPQPWVELQAKYGYTAGFGWFYLHDYFRFEKMNGLDLPTWNHLWFVAYLWVYSLVLALVVGLLPATARARLRRAIDVALAGPRLVIVPVAFWLLIRLTLYPKWGETNDVFSDPYGHTLYASAFFLGVWLAGARRAWDDVARGWRAAAACAVAGYAVYLGVNIAYPGDATPPDWVLGVARTARSIQAWCAIVALLGFARTRFNRDSPARRYLAEAVFPFYIAHQTIIVVAAHLMNQAGVGPLAQFVVLVVVTALGCLAFYEVARRAGVLRPLFGLKLHRARAALAGA